MPCWTTDGPVELLYMVGWALVLLLSAKETDRPTVRGALVADGRPCWSIPALLCTPPCVGSKNDKDASVNLRLLLLLLPLLLLCVVISTLLLLKIDATAVAVAASMA